MRAGRDLQPRLSPDGLPRLVLDLSAHLSKVGYGLIEFFGVFDLWERIAEKHRREHKSIQKGGEDGDRISVEDEWGQNRIGYFPHDVPVGDSDRFWPLQCTPSRLLSSSWVRLVAMWLADVDVTL